MRYKKVNEKQTSNALIMIFGATGDLANRKLFPSLYRLYKKGKLANFAVVGVGRRTLTQEQFKQNVVNSVSEAIASSKNDDLETFASYFCYHSHDVTDSSSYAELKNIADDLDVKYSLNGNRVFYLVQPLYLT